MMPKEPENLEDYLKIIFTLLLIIFVLMLL